MRRTLAAVVVLSGLHGAWADDRQSIAPLPGEQVVLSLHGVGAQIYRCQASQAGALAWTFEAPRADLQVDGRTVGHHGAGPFWQSTDGSRITGRVDAKAPSPDPASIPWLRLGVTSHTGSGVLDQVDGVLRTNTSGGVKSGSCGEPGATFEAPYEADYVFLRHG